MRYEEILPGLGDRFGAEGLAALFRTVELPESAPVYAGEFRRLLVRKFDHGIFYRIHGARIVVTAVLDLRQDPNDDQAAVKPLSGTQCRLQINRRPKVIIIAAGRSSRQLAKKWFFPRTPLQNKGSSFKSLTSFSA